MCWSRQALADLAFIESIGIAMGTTKKQRRQEEKQHSPCSNQVLWTKHQIPSESEAWIEGIGGILKFQRNKYEWI